MNIEQVNKIYFLGIGGIGMSALARFFKVVDVQFMDTIEFPLLSLRSWKAKVCKFIIAKTKI